MATSISIRDLKQGDYFILSEPKSDFVSSSSVWVRQHYDRSSKTFSACKYDDLNHEHFFKPNKKVFIDFDF